MKLTVKDIQGKDQGEMEVKLPLIENGKGTQAVHQTVVAFSAAQRMGTACTKNVGEVAGTNKKPWRQKGTGRARAGSFQSPLWRGGGVVFGPRPRDFSAKVSRATRQLALRKALSERLKAGDVLMVDDLKLASPKTRNFWASFPPCRSGRHGPDRRPRRRLQLPPRLPQRAPRRVDHGRIAQHLPGLAQRQIGLYPRRLRAGRKAPGQGIT